MKTLHSRVASRIANTARHDRLQSSSGPLRSPFMRHHPSFGVTPTGSHHARILHRSIHAPDRRRRSGVPMNPPVREKGVHCSRCDALCCRLTVVLFEEDAIPAHLTARNEQGVTVMARDADGWCVALNNAQMNCGIYETRPTICRKFAMAGPYCRDVRAEAARATHPLPIALVG
jgi:uncharacterized protein